MVSSICFLICSTRALMSAPLPRPSTIVVLSLSTTTFFARPSMSTVTDSSLMPMSSLMSLPPVRIAMSSRIAFRRSPKPGALTAQTWNVPRSLFTTSVASASPSTSSAMIMSGRPDFATAWRSGSMSCRFEIFFSKRRTNGFSSSHSIDSAFVTKYGER